MVTPGGQHPTLSQRTLSLRLSRSHQRQDHLTEMFSGLQTTVRASGGGVEIAEREIETKIYIYDITPINLILNASLDFLFLNMAQTCNIVKL